eukprot:3797155-Pleurochrysis_carterae.AAC.3
MIAASGENSERREQRCSAKHRCLRRDLYGEDGAEQLGRVQRETRQSKRRRKVVKKALSNSGKEGDGYARDSAGDGGRTGGDEEQDVGDRGGVAWEEGEEEGTRKASAEKHKEFQKRNW